MSRNLKNGLEGVSRETLSGPFCVNVVYMSYQIKVTSAGGELTVEATGDVPEGTHYVSGHEDASNRSLSVSRTDQDGKNLIQASAGHPKAG